MMRARADLGVVTHLTLLELRTAGGDVRLASTGSAVWVCENPQVLQAAARAGASGPLLCLAGNPAAVGWLVLRCLLANGADVRYHGNLDWSGVTIAARAIGAGARPWRLSADAYEAAVATLRPGATLPLSGQPVATAWDPALQSSMRRRGIAVHEESQLPLLLADLGSGVELDGAD